MSSESSEVDWGLVAELAAAPDMEALGRAATTLGVVDFPEEFRAVSDAVASLMTLRAIAARRDRLPDWFPLLDAIRDEMAPRPGVGRG